jgi:hypothetical protein
MASWNLACKKCLKSFAYSQISETFVDYFMPSRPEFPPDGVELECPNCQAKSTYYRTDLTYQSAPTGRGHSAR